MRETSVRVPTCSTISPSVPTKMYVLTVAVIPSMQNSVDGRTPTLEENNTSKTPFIKMIIMNLKGEAMTGRLDLSFLQREMGQKLHAKFEKLEDEDNFFIIYSVDFIL
uniref:Uncharacterized protein n=1 Tax=Romanomermis culicivorax TaxID=13658 RepID=A0A915IIM1_ROMCU